ncbi:MAG: hypothetical protein IIC89_02550, partial [Chloroflexi bacterium]|nr:hypothetical protein [Chloroflexota bacterium]
TLQGIVISGYLITTLALSPDQKPETVEAFEEAVKQSLTKLEQHGFDERNLNQAKRSIQKYLRTHWEK